MTKHTPGEIVYALCAFLAVVREEDIPLIVKITLDAHPEVVPVIRELLKKS